MVLGERNIREKMKVSEKGIKNIEGFTCFGYAMTHYIDCKGEIALRITKKSWICDL